MRIQALLFSASLIVSTAIVPVGLRAACAQTAAENVAADNSAQNQRDRDHQSLTPIDQSSRPADLEMTRNIRRALVKDEQLSTQAKNIRNGNILISVHTENRRQRNAATDIFEHSHASDISYTGEARV